MSDYSGSPLWNRIKAALEKQAGFELPIEEAIILAKEYPQESVDSILSGAGSDMKTFVQWKAQYPTQFAELAKTKPFKKILDNPKAQYVLDNMDNEGRVRLMVDLYMKSGSEHYSPREQLLEVHGLTEDGLLYLPFGFHGVPHVMPWGDIGEGK